MFIQSIPQTERFFNPAVTFDAFCFFKTASLFTCRKPRFVLYYSGLIRHYAPVCGRCGDPGTEFGSMNTEFSMQQHKKRTEQTCAGESFARAGLLRFRPKPYTDSVQTGLTAVLWKRFLLQRGAPETTRSFFILQKKRPQTALETCSGQGAAACGCILAGSAHHGLSQKRHCPSAGHGGAFHRCGAYAGA